MRALAALALIVAATAAFVTTARPTSAGLDLSGTWEARYSLTCQVVVDQSGSALSGDFACGAGAEGTLTGTVDEATGAFTLNGSLGLIMTSIEGRVVDGDTLAGSFSAPPLALEGSFTGDRDGSGSASDLSGAWTLTLLDVFAGGCTVEIDHQGAELSATLDCETTAAVELEGSLDGDEVELIGSFGNGTLTLAGTVADDGASVEGTWTLAPLEVTGTFVATRQGGPPDEEPVRTPRGRDEEEPTPTEAVGGLPDTGTGAGGDSMRWRIVALAGAGLLGAGTLLARRRA
jgi:hypothetical protein